MNTGDILTGIGGTNTLSITGNGNAAPVNGVVSLPLVETTNIQNVNVRSVENTIVSQALMSGVVNAASGGSLATTTFTGADLNTRYALNNTQNLADGNANLTVNYTAAAGTADKALLSVANAGGKLGSTNITQTIDTTAVTGAVEAIDLVTTGANRVALGGGANVATFTISGDGVNNITINNAATAMKVDASGATAANTISVGSLLSTTDTIIGGSAADTLAGTISTATQMIPTISAVETLDLTFSAAGTFNASNVTDATKLIVTPTAAATFTNVADEVTTIQVGKTTTLAGAALSVGYATGSESDVNLTLGATPTSGTAAVSIGRLTVSGNKGDLTITSNGSATNTIAVAETVVNNAGQNDSGVAVVANSAAALTIAGGDRALVIENNQAVGNNVTAAAASTISATGAATVEVDASLKDVTIRNNAVVQTVAKNNAFALDETLQTFDIASGAGVATVGNINVDSSVGTAKIDSTFNVTAGAKNAVVGNIVLTSGASAGATSAAALNIETTGDGTARVEGLSATRAGTASTTTSLTLNIDAATASATLGTIDLRATDAADITISAASGYTARVETLLGGVDGSGNPIATGALSSITASGAGTINLFTTTVSGQTAVGATGAVAGDAVVNATGTTGDFSLDLSLATGNLNVSLGNAVTGKSNVVVTGSGADVIVGGSGVDNLTGGRGADVINGNAGNDTITGGMGNDVVTGGTGTNTFVFVTSGGLDTVTDYSTGTDNKLDVYGTGLIINASKAGSAFVLLSGAITANSVAISIGSTALTESDVAGLFGGTGEPTISQTGSIILFRGDDSGTDYAGQLFVVTLSQAGGYSATQFASLDGVNAAGLAFSNIV